MEHVQFGIWSVWCDADETRRAYASLPPTAPDACSCNGCLNVAAVRHRGYPARLLHLFEALGIDRYSPAELYMAGPIGPDRVRYEGSFFFVGTLDQEIQALEHIDEDAAVWFTARPGALMQSAFDGYPVVQLEFYSGVPWVVDANPFGRVTYQNGLWISFT